MVTSVSQRVVHSFVCTSVDSIVSYDCWMPEMLLFTISITNQVEISETKQLHLVLYSFVCVDLNLNCLGHLKFQNDSRS